MVREWEKKYPGRTDNMLTAMGKVVPSHLMDRNLFPFTTVRAEGRPVADGDIAFDEEPCAPPTGAAAANASPETVSLHPWRPSAGQED